VVVERSSVQRARVANTATFALIAVATHGCSAGELAVHLPLPPHAGAQSMIVAIEAQRRLTLVASTLDGSEKVELAGAALGSGQDVRVVALVYREHLDALGLEPGPLEQASAGADARPLPAGSSMFEVRLPGESDAAWAPTQTLGPALTDVRLPAAETPCREFDVRVHGAPTAAHSAFLLPLGPREAFAATRDERFFRFDLDGDVSEIFPETSGAPALSAIVDGDGFWLSGSGGAVAEAHVNGTILRHTPVTSAPGGGVVRWIAGGTTASGPELVTLTENGRLSRWDGAHVDTAHRALRGPGR
jgi:hypothetical protein